MNPDSRHSVTRIVVVAAALLGLPLAGCGNFLSPGQLDNFSITYKIDIQQGVVVTREMADQLKTGMTRDQVRFVLGTPILADPFHAERWDYPFRFQPGRGPIEQRQFTVWFENDRMARFTSDPLPTEEEFAASRNFATTHLAKAPLPGSPIPPPPGSTAPSAGGATTVTPPTRTSPDTGDAPAVPPPPTN